MSDARLEVRPEDLRCSTQTRALGEQPGGTAGSWHRVILVELPLPWPDSIDDHPMLAGIDPVTPDGRTHRILALASALSPGDARPDDGLRVICYWRLRDGPFSQFSRAEICAPDDDVAEIVSHLIEADDEALAAIPADSFAAGPALASQPVRDLLICTHGTRDRCCGKFGTNLFRALVDRVPDDVRLWRTSHTGGHRFSPTGLTFPDGYVWAGLDEAMTLGLLDRSLDPLVAGQRARGSAGIDGGPAQVADIAGLSTSGWTWLDESRSVSAVIENEGLHAVSVSTPDREYRAEVAAGRTVPVPVCGKPLDAARKSAMEWELSSFDEV